MHTLARFCESRRRFSLLLSLKYLYISFFRSLPAPCLLPCSPPPLSRRKAIRAPLSSLPASAPLVLRSCSCRVFRGCRVSSGVSPSASPSPWLVPSCLLCVHPIGHAPKLFGGLPSCLLCLVVLWWLPSLVRHQAQDSMAVWADAPRICPRPCLLLPMCCRWLFRGLSCLLPCVVWW